MLEMLPDTFIRIQFRGVSRETLQVSFLRPAIGEEIFHLVRTMDTPAVPNHRQLATEITRQMTQEGHTIRAGQGAFPRQSRQSSGRCNPAHHRQVVARLKNLQDRRLAAGSIRPDHAGQQSAANRLLGRLQGQSLFMGDKSSNRWLIGGRYPLIEAEVGFYVFSGPFKGQ